MSENSKYQQLRAHLAFLRMTAAAEALPAELDYAMKAKLSHQDFLERAVGRRGRRGRRAPPGEPHPLRLAALAVHVGRLRLLGPAQRRQEADRRTGHTALRRRRHQRALDRPTRRRQDNVGGRPRARRGGRGDAHLLHDRRRSGGTVPSRRPRGPLGHDHALLRRTAALDHRRSGLSASSCRSGGRAVPSGQPEISQGLYRADHQLRGSPVGARSSTTTRWSPAPCWIACCTEAWCSPSTATVTGCAATGPGPRPADERSRDHDEPQRRGRVADSGGGGRSHLTYTHQQLAATLINWGISVIESGEKSVILTNGFKDSADLGNPSWQTWDTQGGAPAMMK